MPDLDLCFTPATEIAEGIRNRVLSSEAVVRNALERIEQVNGTLNCFVFTYPDEAIELARAADAAVARGDELGALHGVPIAIKDLTPTAGKRTTFGSYAFEHHVPERSALLVERLLGAGGIMVGKTATPGVRLLELHRLAAVGRDAQPVGHRPAHRAARPAAPARRSRPAACRSRRAPTWAGRCAFRRRGPASCGLKPSFGRIPLDFLPDPVRHDPPLRAARAQRRRRAAVPAGRRAARASATS